MGEREATLFHGTETIVAEFDLERMHYLYGYLSLELPSLSANLTNNFDTARKFALRRADYVTNFACVVEIVLPQSEVKKVGDIDGYDGDSYITTDFVSVSAVPDHYLNKTNLSRETAERMEAKGELLFYRVPKEKVKKIHYLSSKE